MRIAEMMEEPYDKGKMGKILLCVFGVCAGIYLLLLGWMNQRVVTVDVSGCNVQAAEKMNWKIEKMAAKDGYMTIKGYAYEPGVSEDRSSTMILAYDAASGQYYRLPTENVRRTKITEEVNDGYNYDYAGFTSVVYVGKVPSGSEVCIRYQGNKKDILIATGEKIVY